MILVNKTKSALPMTKMDAAPSSHTNTKDNRKVCAGREIPCQPDVQKGLIEIT